MVPSVAPVPSVALCQECGAVPPYNPELVTLKPPPMPANCDLITAYISLQCALGNFKRPTSTKKLWLDRLRLSYKKTLHASEQSRPDVIERRKAWQETLANLPAAKLVFVYESGANTQMPRRYGRSPVGERLVCAVPHGHYQTTAMIAGVRLAGSQAPCLIEGAMHGVVFLAWVWQGLATVLNRRDIVVLDNRATHKVAGLAFAAIPTDDCRGFNLNAGVAI